MTKMLKDDTSRVLEKLNRLKERMNIETNMHDPAAANIVNNVALSKEISNELKEVLILLHTTMSTEFIQARMTNYKLNMDIISVTEEIIILQRSLIDKLSTTDKSGKDNKITKSSFLNVYKIPVSIIMVVGVLWALTVFNKDAMSDVYDNLPNIIKGAK